MPRIKPYILTTLFVLISLAMPLDQSSAGDKPRPAADRMIENGQPSNTDEPLTGAEADRTHQDTTPPAGSSDPKTAAKKSDGNSRSQTQTAVKPIDPNRRWIMKQKNYTGKSVQPKKPKLLKWTDAGQQIRCRTYKRALAASFDQARYYSIKGDRCKTAQHANDFLKTAQTSRQTCPDQFLESSGYGRQVVRNMGQLEALGQESCLGKMPPPPSEVRSKKAKAPL